jgi:hypothetical protein
VPVRFTFHRAVKRDAKLRLAIAGPGGSGKTYTTLKLATELGGRIAMYDTEHGSAEKYADLFTFDVLDGGSYDPDIIAPLIEEVAAQGYSTLIVDSWSHFWMGEGGELDQVDQISARSRSNNNFAAWRTVSPKHNRMVDAMLAAPIHVMVTMRVKTEWVVDKNEQGKSVPRKVGMAPVMKDGVEYEFDVCGDMDLDNTLCITKSRCPILSGKAIQKPGAGMAKTLRVWLNSSVPDDAPSIADIQRDARAIDTGGNAIGTQAAADYVAERKIEALQAAAPPAEPPKPPVVVTMTPAPPPEKPWNNRGEMRQVFAGLRELIGETSYHAELEEAGVRDPSEFRTAEKAKACYARLLALADKEAA